MANHAQLATDVLAAIGGKENVIAVTHCMTRLRFNLKDDSIPNDEEIRKIPGVLQIVRAGGQVQIVIGPAVDKVYDEVCKLGAFTAQAAIDENLDGPKQKMTPKVVLNNILGAMSGSITPVLPAFIVAGILKMIAVLLGPKTIGIISDTSDLYRFCSLASDAIYHFLPMFIAYSASKKFNCNTVYMLVISSVMLFPSLAELIASTEAPFTVFAIPVTPVNYSRAVLPIIVIAWAMSYVERWVKKIVPDVLRVMGVPLLTLVIMFPLSLCAIGPIFSIIMGYVANGVVWMTNNIGLPTMAIIAAIWPLVIIMGVHVPVLSALSPVRLEMGYDAIMFPATIAHSISVVGVELGYALRAKGSDNKALGWSCFATTATAKISEPYLYGIYLRDWKAMLWNMLGAVSGAVTMGILGAKVTIFSGMGFLWLDFLRFGEDAIFGAIGMIVAFSVSFGLSVIFGFTGSETGENNPFAKLKRKQDAKKKAAV